MHIYTKIKTVTHNPAAIVTVTNTSTATATITITINTTITTTITTKYFYIIDILIITDSKHFIDIMKIIYRCHNLKFTIFFRKL